MPKNRMPPGLVALSTTAIAAIYMAGYLRTQAADASIDAPSSAAPVAPVAAAAPTQVPTPTLTPHSPAAQSRSTAPTSPIRGVPTPTAAPSTVAAAGYKDGTYSGHGTSRRGDVWVDVTVGGGRITSVKITRSTLQYPLRDIADLPDEVVQRQSAQVDIVSRATYSSQAFRGAVSQALSSAVGA